jgi:hypothetical protein
MRPNLYLLVFLGLVGAQPVCAEPVEAVADAIGKVAEAVGKAFDFFAARITATQKQLDQDKKDALASIGKDLTTLSALKVSMADNLRCLGSSQGGSNNQSAARFSQCWHLFQSQNEELGTDLRELKKSMDAADPNWHTAHQDEVKAIDDLYWKKMVLEGNVLVFVQTSRGGLLTHVSVDPIESGKLANALDDEAVKLTEAAKKLTDVLRGSSPNSNPG